MAKRIIKEYAARRSEILAAAEKLFFKNGYDATPVESIISETGISKGTFYYYFKSKEELLDALVTDRALAAFAKIDRLVFEHPLNALDRMKLYFESSRSWKMEHRELLKPLIKMLYSPQNLLLRQKMMAKQLEVGRPTLTRIVRQGVEEGIFNTPYPEDIAEMLFSLFGNTGEQVAMFIDSVGSNPQAVDTLMHKFTVYQHLFERILGAPEGSLEFVDKTYLKKYLGGI